MANDRPSAETKNVPPGLGCIEIVSQLRKAARGRHIWRVQDKASGAYCIEFTDFERWEAEAWWKENSEKFPEYHANNELKRVHIQTSTERLMIKAADMLESMSG